MYPDRFKIPLPTPPRVVMHGQIPDQIQYDEAYYDYQTATYRTRSQDVQIQRLKEELEEKKRSDRDKVKSIIGYFFKRRYPPKQ